MCVLQLMVLIRSDPVQSDNGSDLTTLLTTAAFNEPKLEQNPDFFHVTRVA